MLDIQFVGGPVDGLACRWKGPVPEIRLRDPIRETGDGPVVVTWYVYALKGEQPADGSLRYHFERAERRVDVVSPGTPGTPGA